MRPSEHVRYTPWTDPLRRGVVGRTRSVAPPDRVIHRSFTPRDHLVKLGVTAHRVLVASPPVLVEWHVLAVVVFLFGPSTDASMSTVS